MRTPTSSRRAERPTPLAQELAERAATNIQTTRNLAERGISTTTANANNTFFQQDGQPRFLYTYEGEVTNIKSRYIDAEGQKRFRVEGGSIRIPFLYDRAFDRVVDGQDNRIIITEGEIDALSAVQAGANAISLPNGANPNFEWAENAEDLLLRPDVIPVLALDHDPSGDVVEPTLAAMLGKHRCLRVAYPEDCKDLNDVLVKHGEQAVRTCIGAAEPYPVEGIIRPSSIRGALHDLYDGRNYGNGISTGWSIMDEVYTVKKGQFTVINGAPGSGKSEFIDAMLVNLARIHGMRFAVYSPEYHPPERYLAKWIEKYSGYGFFSGIDRLPREYIDGYVHWAQNHLSILMPEEPTVDALLDLIAVESYRNQIDGVLIDNWTEVIRTHGDETETQWIGSQITRLREHARNHDYHMWVVTHPTKLPKQDDGNYVVPKPYEIMGSSHWFNKADNILTIWRDMIGQRPVQVHIQKVRYKEIGQPALCEYTFNRTNGRYSGVQTTLPSGETVTGAGAAVQEPTRLPGLHVSSDSPRSYDDDVL